MSKEEKKKELFLIIVLFTYFIGLIGLALFFLS